MPQRLAFFFWQVLGTKHGPVRKIGSLTVGSSDMPITALFFEEALAWNPVLDTRYLTPLLMVTFSGKGLEAAVGTG